MAEGMLPPLIAHLRADISHFQKAMATAVGETNTATSGMARAFNGMAGVGKVALLGVAGSTAIVGGASLKMAGDYEAATVRLITSAGETHKNIDLVRKGMLQMAGEVGISAQELAKAMYTVESAGFHGAEGLTVLRAASEGAKAEGADLKVVADAVTSALVDYHLGAKDAAQVTTTLITAVSQGKTTFGELTGALHSVLPQASAAGISLADITAALASMTVHGMSADQASQNLAHAISHLQKITGPQARELALLGIDAQELSAKLGERGLTGTLHVIDEAILKSMGGSKQVILEMQTALRGLPPDVQALGRAVIDGSMSLGDFSKASKGLSVEQAGLAHQFATLMTNTHGLGQNQKTGKEIMQSYSAATLAAAGDQTAMNVQLMIGGDNWKYTENAVKVTTAAQKENGNHVKGWADIQGTFNQHLAQSAAKTEALGITIGTVLIPHAIKAMDAITKLVDWFSKHQAAAVALALVIGVPLVAAMVAYIIQVGIATWHTIELTAKTIAHGIASAATAIKIGAVAVATGLWAAAQWVLNFAMAAFPAILIIAAIAALVVGVIYAYNHWGWFHDAVNKAWDALKSFGNWIQNTLGPWLHGLGDAIGGAASKLGTLAEKAASLPGVSGAVAAMAKDASLPGRAGGGPVGPGQAYLVGEGGPEMLVMGSSGGYVYPNVRSAGDVDAGGSGGDMSALAQKLDTLIGLLQDKAGMQINVYAQTNADPNQIARELAWAMKTG